MREPPSVVIAPSDPAWPRIAARLTQTIQQACGDVLAGVEHIGSTSVPGLAAKPIIDLMPVVSTFEAGARCIEPMLALGYEHRGEYGIPRRHYFVGTDAESGLVVHVHMLPVGHVQWRTHRLFRDYLRTHADEADAYAATKREIASRVSRADYPDAKAPWVEAAIARAEEWARTGAWEADR